MPSVLYIAIVEIRSQIHPAIVSPPSVQCIDTAVYIHTNNTIVAVKLSIEHPDLKMKKRPLTTSCLIVPWPSLHILEEGYEKPTSMRPSDTDDQKYCAVKIGFGKCRLILRRIPTELAQTHPFNLLD